MLRLPEEMWASIIAYMDITSAWQISYTSKELMRYTGKYVKLEVRVYSNKMSGMVLKKFKNTTLAININEYNGELKYREKITKLDLKNIDDIYPDNKYLNDLLLSSLINLRTLKIRGCEGISDEGFKTLQKLESLSIYYCDEHCYTSPITDYVFKYIPNLRKLRIDEDSTLITCEGLKKISGLTNLNMSHIVTDDVLLCLTNLRKLTINTDCITEEGLKIYRN